VATSCRQRPRLDVAVLSFGTEVWIDVSGEADSSNHVQLRDGLSAVGLDGVEVIRLLLGGLTFCDVCGFRELLTFAKAAGSPSRDISVHDASRTVRRIAGILDEERVLGLA
jgi:anti-anti-sigma regulatory factor